MEENQSTFYREPLGTNSNLGSNNNYYDSTAGQYSMDAKVLGGNNTQQQKQTQMSGLDIANTALSGLAALGNLYTAHEQNKIAKSSLKFEKDAFRKNFALYQADRARRVNRENSIDRQMAEINGREYKDINAKSEAKKDSEILSA